MSLLFVGIAALYLLLLLFLLYGFFKISVFCGKNAELKTTFSIVIPFRNEAENLPELFKSLEKLKYPSDKFEILLVNDASEDHSENLCRDFIAANPQLQIRLLQNDNFSGSPKKNAINTAVKNATFEYILTTDADCSVPAVWLQQLDAIISAEDPAAIAGPVEISTSGNDSFTAIFQKLDFLSLQAATIGGFGAGQAFLCNGANFCYSKKAFLTVAGFSGNEETASGDDIFLLEKFRKENLKVSFLKSKKAVVITQPQPGLRTLLNQRLRWASKMTSGNQLFGTAAGAIVLLMNFSIITGIILLVTRGIGWKIYFSILLLKFLLDFCFVYVSARFFSKKSLLKHFLWNFFIYLFFSSFVGCAAFFLSFEWKGRRFKK